MKTVVKLMAILILASLAVSCTKTAGTTPPTATTVPPVAPPSMTTPPATSSPTLTLTITFDFDAGSPAPSLGQSTPFDYALGGVTAHFSSPADPATFSVQNHDTTFFILSQFFGNYLSDNNPFRNALEIKFSHPLSSIRMTFATTDSHGPGNVEEPSNMRLTAYLDSKMAQVGSATARGSFSNDTFPQGELSFNSGSKPFNLITIELLPQTPGGTSFLVDNITVTAANPNP